jgi:conjugative transfer pilus assembly protein TraH
MNMKMRNVALAVSLALVTVGPGAQATWLEDFVTSAGAGSNVTQPQAIAGQGVVGFSGGGVSWRVANKSYQPFNVQPPSLKAGCGGIDAYLGSYSFINKDEFVNALRNVGQAAVGYFFELALKSLAPEIAATLDVMNELATRVNQFGMNSCQEAQKLVKGLAGKTFDSDLQNAKSRYVSVGSAVDNFAAGLGFQNAGFSGVLEQNALLKYGTTNPSSVPKATYASAIPSEVNVVWYALILANADATESTMDQWLAMSVIGPKWIRRSANSSGDGSAMRNDGKDASIKFKELVGGPHDGPVQFKVLTCSDNQCLSPGTTTYTMRSYSALAYQTMHQLRLGIIGRTAPVLTAEQSALLRLTSVPLYRVASLSATSGTGATIATALMDDIAEVAGMEAAMEFMQHKLDIVERAVGLLQAKGDAAVVEETKQILERCATIRRDMAQEAAQAYKKHGNPYEKVDQLDRIERTMYASLNRNLAANARFATRN